MCVKDWPHSQNNATTLQSSRILAWASAANIQYCKFNMSDVRVEWSRTSDSMSFNYSLLTSQHTQACLPSNPHLGNKHLSQYNVHSPQSLIRLKLKGVPHTNVTQAKHGPISGPTPPWARDATQQPSRYKEGTTYAWYAHICHTCHLTHRYLTTELHCVEVVHDSLVTRWVWRLMLKDCTITHLNKSKICYYTPHT